MENTNEIEKLKADVEFWKHRERLAVDEVARLCGLNYDLRNENETLRRVLEAERVSEK